MTGFLMEYLPISLYDMAARKISFEFPFKIFKFASKPFHEVAQWIGSEYKRVLTKIHDMGFANCDIKPENTRIRVLGSELVQCM